jgi:hypothetical protein
MPEDTSYLSLELIDKSNTRSEREYFENVISSNFERLPQLVYNLNSFQ